MRLARWVGGLLAVSLLVVTGPTQHAAATNFPTSYFQPVPQVIMDKPLDCESAALSSALQYQGIGASQDWVFSHLPVDTRPAVKSGGWPARWGNPYEAFVGNVWGSIGYLTGYGVYAPPLIQAARDSGATAIGGESWSMNQLFTELLSGYSIVVLIPYNLDSPTVVPMGTWDNQYAWFSKQDHAQVLAGFDTGAGTVTVMDDFDGRYKTFPISTFQQEFIQFHSTAIAVINPNRMVTPTAAGNVLGRYYDPSDGAHWVTTGPVSDEFASTPGYEEHALGTVSSSPGAGMEALYSCVAGATHFLSLNAGCEGGTVLSTDGYTSISPTQVYSIPIYRCVVLPTGDHFVSSDPACEGMHTEGPLGYVSDVTMLSRWYNNLNHWTSDGAVPYGFQLEGELGGTLVQQPVGGHLLYACLRSFDEFTSLDPGCEGLTRYSVLGWVYDQAPAGITTAELYRCFNGTTHYDSLDSNCEGTGWLEGPMGFVVEPG